MGTLFSTLDIARQGLKTAQVQMDVAGHNISNVNTEGYSRQRVHLAPPSPTSFSFGQIGRGVTISEVRRVRDEFLDTVLRQQVSSLGSAEVQQQYYQLIEDSFLEPSEQAFGVRMNNFFDALNDFANNVESASVREAVVAEAEALTASFNRLAERFDQFRTNANEEIRNVVPQINGLARTIAETNQRIRNSELDESTANDIRDQRDRALDELARLVNINYTQRADGQITVRIGSDVLLDETGPRELYTPIATGGTGRDDLLEVRFEDSDKLVDIRDGELFGAFNMRDVIIPELQNRLDVMANTIIYEMNGIHGQSNGLEMLSGDITGVYRAEDPAAPLDAAGLPAGVAMPSSFDITLYDGAGAQIAGSPFTVNINPGDSMNDLAAQLNGIAPAVMSASVTPEGSLQISMTGDNELAFSNDPNGALAALGMNALFTGSDAANMGVNSAIIDNPNLLSSAQDLDPAAAGDNTAALMLANLRERALLDGGVSTLNEYYESGLAELGVDSRANQLVVDTEQSFHTDFIRRRQEESGVSLDEEVTFMMQYQRAFEASARVINFTERMLDALFTVGG